MYCLSFRRRHTFPVVLLAAVFVLFSAAGGYAGSWNKIKINESNEAITTKVNESSASRIELEINTNWFLQKLEKIDGDEYSLLMLEGNSALFIKGDPALPKVCQSILIPDDAKMGVKVIKSEYTDFTEMKIAPSKGHLSREIDPSKVPYKFSGVYSRDEWYPSDFVSLRDPYIFRDVRGTVIDLNAFQYNPQSGVLRVYHSVTLEITPIGRGEINVKERHRAFESVPPEYDAQYERQFVNYRDMSSSLDYDPIVEVGSMLILCGQDFISEGRVLADWKNQKGIPTELLSVGSGADVENNTASIASIISDRYSTETNLAYVLLIGDEAQVRTSWYFYDGSNYPADPLYARLEGNDAYPELFIGRMSVENLSQAANQVARTIEYERDIPEGSNWLNDGLGIASQESHQGRSDIDQINGVIGILEAANGSCTNYSGIDFVHDPGVSSADISGPINSGRGFIAYSGHGSTTLWGTGGFSTSNVDQLTNDNTLPFVHSVACLVGNFSSTTCFAESWLRATNHSEPSGAIGAYMSSISQPWVPPMDSQTEAFTLLANDTKSLGGICFNGSNQMLDIHGSSGVPTASTWHIFGDPSLQLRAGSPSVMSPTHNICIGLQDVSFAVSNLPAVETLCALSKDGQLIGYQYSTAGSVTIPIDPEIDLSQWENEQIVLTITACRYVTYTTTIDVGPIGGLATLHSTDPTLCEGYTYEFSWTAPQGGATSYIVEWSDNSGFVHDPLQGMHVIESDAITTTSIDMEMVAYNPVGHDWWWRVTTFGLCDPVGQTTNPRTFHVLPTPAAIATYPANGEEICENVLHTYEWEVNLLASSYTIQWARDAAFTQEVGTVIGIEGTSYEHAGISAIGTWYWHVKPVGGFCAGSWSETRSIEVIETFPPVLHSVGIWAEGRQYVCMNEPLEYTWDPAVGETDGYIVQWFAGNSGETVTDECIVPHGEPLSCTHTLLFVPSPPSYERQWFESWRVGADIGACIVWSDIVTYRGQLPPPVVEYAHPSAEEPWLCITQVNPPAHLVPEWIQGDGMTFSIELLSPSGVLIEGEFGQSIWGYEYRFMEAGLWAMRMRATNYCREGEWPAGWFLFNVYDVLSPTLAWPSGMDEKICKDNPVVFDWDDPGNGPDVEYNLEFWGPNGELEIPPVIGETEFNYTFDDETDVGSWSWRVVAHNPHCGGTIASSWASFEVITPPTLHTPIVNHTFCVGDPSASSLFIWENAYPEDNTEFEVHWVRPDQYEEVSEPLTGLITTYTFDDINLHQGTWTWWVEVTEGPCEGMESEHSLFHVWFLITDPIPACPFDEAVYGLGETIDFAWRSHPNSSSFEVTWHDPLGGTNTETVTEPEASHAASMLGEWTWEIEAFDNHYRCGTSTTSETFSYNVVVNPEKPIGPIPADGSSAVAGDIIEFCVGNSPYPPEHTNQWRIEWSDSPYGFPSDVDYEYDLDGCVYHEVYTYQGNPPQYMYWRAGVSDECGVWRYSDVWSVRVQESEMAHNPDGPIMDDISFGGCADTYDRFETICMNRGEPGTETPEEAYLVYRLTEEDGTEIIGWETEIVGQTVDAQWPYRDISIDLSSFEGPYIVEYLWWAQDPAGLYSTSPAWADIAEPGNGPVFRRYVPADPEQTLPATCTQYYASDAPIDLSMIMPDNVVVIKPWAGEDYQIVNSIEIPSGTGCYAEGPNAGLVILGTEQYPLTLNNSTSTWESWDMNGAFLQASYTGFEGGPYLTAVYNESIRLSNCTFSGTSGPILIDGCSSLNSHMHSCIFENRSEEGFAGVSILNSTVDVQNCTITCPNGIGLFLDNAGDSYFEECIVENCYESGLVCGNMNENVRMECCTFQFNGASGEPEVIDIPGTLNFLLDSYCTFMDDEGTLYYIGGMEVDNFLFGRNNFILTMFEGLYIDAQEWIIGDTRMALSDNHWTPEYAGGSFVSPDPDWFECLNELPLQSCPEELVGAVTSVQSEPSTILVAREHIAAQQNSISDQTGNAFALKSVEQTNANKSAVKHKELEQLVAVGRVDEAMDGYVELMSSAETQAESVSAELSVLYTSYRFEKSFVSPKDNRQVKVNSVQEYLGRAIPLCSAYKTPNKSIATTPTTEKTAGVPKEFMLYQNYPNPFNPTTQIKFDLPQAVPVKLIVYDILGQQVATLVDEVRNAGTITIFWDGKNASGLDVATGMYIYQIRAGNFSDTKKMLLLK